MKNKNTVGAVLALVGIIAGILSLYFIADTYNTVIHTHFAAGDWEESNTVRLVYAVLGWLGTTAGAMSAAVLWGFLKNQSWAWLNLNPVRFYFLVGGFIEDVFSKTLLAPGVHDAGR